MTNESFYSKIEDVSIYGINEYLGVPEGYDIEMDSNLVQVHYLMEPDAKEWGLKCIDISVRKVKIIIYWEVNRMDFTDNDNEIFEKIGATFDSYTAGETIEIEVGFGDEKWEIINEAEFTPSGAFSFENIEIDFKKFKLTLT